jgi:hypothetical protein
MDQGDIGPKQTPPAESIAVQRIEMADAQAIGLILTHRCRDAFTALNSSPAAVRRAGRRTKNLPRMMSGDVAGPRSGTGRAVGEHRSQPTIEVRLDCAVSVGATARVVRVVGIDVMPSEWRQIVIRLPA